MSLLERYASHEISTALLCTEACAVANAYHTVSLVLVQSFVLQVLYAKGPVSGIPDTWENRRDMFSEIDRLQEGWTVELRTRGGGATGAVDAVFYDPDGTLVGAFAAARRKALQASRAAA